MGFAMTYESPIEVLTTDLQFKVENDIMTAISSHDIRVDKEELLKALKYDRGQYEKGYREGYHDGANDVKRGVWLDYSDKYDHGMDLRCSVCHARASGFVGGTETWWDSYEPNYCPSCGAKMDGRKSNR